MIFSRKCYFEYISNIYVVRVSDLFVARLDVYHFYLQQTHSVNTSFLKINALHSTVTPIYVTGNYYQSISLVTRYKYIISSHQKRSSHCHMETKYKKHSLKKYNAALFKKMK